MNKYIGIYLAPPPGQNMTNQGIGRVLAYLIHGLLKRSGYKVVVAIPSWSRPDFCDLLADHNIGTDKVEFVDVQGLPIWLRVKNYAEKWSKRRTSHGLTNILRGLFECLSKIILKTLALRSFLKAFLIFLGLFAIIVPLTVFAAVVFFPLAVVFGFIGFCAKFGLKFVRRSIRFFFGEQYSSIIKLQSLVSPASAFRRIASAQKVYSFLRKHEVDLLVRKVNERRDVSVWFVPALFWPEVADIRQRKVIAAPDFVTVDFPTSFRDPVVRELFESCAVTAQSADRLVCYSKYVRDKHLVARLGIPEKRISVIYNGVADLSTYLCSDTNGTIGFDGFRSKALDILGRYQKAELSGDLYLRDFDFSTAKFIFYSSQVRPHKNFKNLIDAYEKLLRRDFVNVKLFLTAKLEYAPEILKIVQDRRLHRDIVPFFEVPSEVLASLNCLAECAVVPTLFEGGFPSFSFSEAYSVGTPCLMSKIPVTLERGIDESLADLMLFDPLNVEDMVRKIRFGIDNRRELFEVQRQVWDMLNKQSWDDIAGEYIDVIDRCALSG